MGDLDVRPAPSGAAATGPELAHLLRLAARGDADAFMRFYDATIRVVYDYARLRYDDQVAVEDAVCSIYARAWRCAAGHAGSGLSPGAWLLLHGSGR